MAIDPISEEIVTFSQAPRRLPRLRSNRPLAWRENWPQGGMGSVTPPIGSRIPAPASLVNS
jgi:hypothetical protein